MATLIAKSYDPSDDVSLDPVLLVELEKRLSKEERRIAKELKGEEASALVRLYYALQDLRISQGNRLRTKGGPLAEHFFAQAKRLEQAITVALDVYTDNDPLLRWMRSQYGVGPTLAAAWNDALCWRKPPRPEIAPQKWALAGFLENIEWKKGQKRPFSAWLKRVSFVQTDVWVKFSNRNDCFYGRFWKKSKQRLIERNLSGGFADYCRRRLKRKLSSPYAEVYKSTYEYRWLMGCVSVSEAEDVFEGRKTTLQVEYGRPGSGQPMVPPQGIHRIACVTTAKLFISHVCDVRNFLLFPDYERPGPYAFDVLGHDPSQYIAPPNPPEGWYPPKSVRIGSWGE